LHAAADESERGMLSPDVEAARQLGLAAQWLEGTEARQAEPLLAPDLVGAAYLPEVYSGDAPHFVYQLARAAIRRGALLREGVMVVAFRHAGSRVTQVGMSGGPVAPGSVVLAAGAWSAPLAAQLGLRVPVGPQRGQIMALRSAGPALRHVVHGAGGYLVPKRNG
ncbi:MAG: glycine oxidase ThiO, partial [Chloroflexota bacterium]